MLKIIRWPFKRFTNFLITSMGVVFVGFNAFTIHSESKFNQPIIAQSVKLLGNQTQIRQLVGYPLSYSFSISNKIVQKQKQNYYSFQVKGPKCSTNVQMTATKMSCHQVYEPQQLNTKINELSKKLEQSKKMVNDLQSKLNNKNVKQKKDLIVQKKQLQIKIHNLQTQLLQNQYQKFSRIKKFYVPESALYNKINEVKNRNNPQKIDDNQILWGFNDLIITLPNRTKIIVLPQKKKQFQQRIKQMKQSKIQTNKPTIQSLNSRLAVDFSQFSRQQIDIYAKQKTQFLYSKYNSFKFITVLMFVGMAVFLFKKNKQSAVKSIKNSIIQQTLKTNIQHNKKVKQIMNAKNIKQYSFDELIAGGISKNNINCTLYLKQLKNGKIKVIANTLSQGSSQLKIQKLQLQYRQNNQIKRVDLLV